MHTDVTDGIDTERLAAVCRQYGISALFLFGSFVRGEASASSDVDVLYELRPGARLGWEIEDLADELEEIFGGRSIWLLAPGCIRGLRRRFWGRRGRSMQRDLLLLEEMIDAAEQAHSLVAGRTVAEIKSDRVRRDALLWNFTVLGEAATRVSDETKNGFLISRGETRCGCATESSTATGQWTSGSCTRPRRSSSGSSSSCYAARWPSCRRDSHRDFFRHLAHRGNRCH